MSRTWKERVEWLESEFNDLKREVKRLKCKSGEHGDWKLEKDCCGEPTIICGNCFLSKDKLEDK